MAFCSNENNRHSLREAEAVVEEFILCISLSCVCLMARCTFNVCLYVPLNFFFLLSMCHYPFEICINSVHSVNGVHVCVIYVCALGLIARLDCNC